MAILRIVLTIGLPLLVWFTPRPAGVEENAWRLFAIFLGTIAGLILQPWPMGAVVLIALAISTLLGVLSIADGLSGYSNSTVWLIDRKSTL